MLYFCMKMLVAWRERQANTWLTMKFETFSSWWNWHWSARQKILSLPTIILYWHHLFLVLLHFCCNYFLLFSKNFIEPKLKSSKVHFILPFYAHSSHNERWQLFLRQLQRLVELWEADQSYSHTDNAWLKCWRKKKKKKGSISWKMWAVLIFCGLMGALAFRFCGQ